MSICQVIYIYYVYTSTETGEYLIIEAVFSISLNFILQFYCIPISSSLGTLTTYVFYTEYTSSMRVCRDLCQSQWYDTLWCFTVFAVLKYGCVAGIMVTVSHNPKQNNGYKVYWDNRAQVGDTYCT